MKKLLLSLAAVAASSMAFTANAVDFYLIGGFNNWASAQESCKFTPQSDGVNYVLDLNGTLTSGFKINDGTWNNDNYNFGSAGDDDVLTIGATYNLTVAGTSGNILIKGGESVANPHIVFNPTAKTLLITGQAQAVETIYGIHGNWYDSSWSTTNLTEQNGKWVLAKTDIPAGEFGIKAMDKATGSQLSWISAASSDDVVIKANTPANCKVDGTNFSNPAGNFEVVFDPQAMTITFNGTQTGDAPEVNPMKDWWVNVMGPYNEWSTDGNGAQPDADSNIATINNVAVGDTGFKIKIWNGSKDIYYIAESNPIALNTWVDLIEDTEDGPVIQFADASATSVINVQYNVETNKVYVALADGEVTPPAAQTIYIVGSDINNASLWEASTSNKMTYDEEAGTYSWTGTQLGSGFKFFNGSWNTGVNIGADADAEPLTIGKPYAVINGENPGDIQLPANVVVMNPTVILDLENLTVTVTGTVGEEAPYVPEEVYFVGATDTEWKNQFNYKLSLTSNGMYTGVVTIPASEIVEFKINPGKGAWYGCMDDEQFVTFTGTMATVLEMNGDANAGNWLITDWDGGNIVATVDWTAKTLSLVATEDQEPEIPGSSAVDSLESENGEVVIYNLQGLKVNPANLTPGLYIINGKKTLVK